MDYRKFGECYYIRMDRDDEIISTLLKICKKENIRIKTYLKRVFTKIVRL